MTQTINLTIQTTQGDWNNDFPKTLKIQDVISQVIQHFGFATGGGYVLTRASNDEELLPQRPLVSFNFEENEILVLSDIGVAV